MNLSERRDVKLLAKEAKSVEMQDANLIRDVMGNPHGRAWMLRKLERCHIFQQSFTPNANQTAFNEGERNIGLLFLNDIMLHCPEQYITMMQERSSHDAARSAAAERASRQNRDRGVEEPSLDDPVGNGDYDPDYRGEVHTSN